MDPMACKVAKIERFDAPEIVDQLATELADQIKSSKHLIAFTGAGVSTSAGIPDFRGPSGAWTLRAQGKELKFKAEITLQAIPTPTHMALVELQNRGILKYLVSQNCDGLHRRSGILADRISELHGNSNREYCKGCGKEYIRDFRAVSTYEKSYNDHRTGRKCANCGDSLHDTIINFGEDLPEAAFKLASTHAKKADLCLVLGSSLTVTPANQIPEVVGRSKKAKLAICNLQETPLDADAHLRIHTRTDDLMIRTMDKLKIPIPAFSLCRRVAIQVQLQGEKRYQLKIYGVDVDGTPVTFLQSVRLEGTRRALRSEPFVFSIRDSSEYGPHVNLELEFMGHYGEPNLVITHEYLGEPNKQTLYLLDYSPLKREWNMNKQRGFA